MSDPVVRLAARGDGVTASGAFVTGGVPGDVVEADGSLTPGPHRQAPPCRHFGTCGGCQLQHVDDATYAAFIVDRIVSALAAQGIADVEIRPPHLSPPFTRRRTSLKVSRVGKRIILGFSEARSNAIVDLVECPVLHPALTALLPELRSLFAALGLGKRAANVTMTLVDQGIDLMLSGVAAEGLAASEALTAFAQRYRLARLSIDEGYGPSARWEPGAVTIALGGLPVALPEGAFLQATADGEATLVAAVNEAVTGMANVADLFAGLGTFTFNIDGRVHAVEGARDAILALQTAARQSRKLVTAEHRDLFRRPLTAAELSRFDAVILDPPRAGAKEQVGELASSSAPKIAYVSCNPATFGRDARTLIDGGYRLDWIAPVGQFRWSTHVELAACFSR